MQQLKYLKNIQKKGKERQDTAGSNGDINIRVHGKTKARKKNWRKNNCTDTSSDKQGGWYTW